jgi:hypothetical protein
VRRLVVLGLVGAAGVAAWRERQIAGNTERTSTTEPTRGVAEPT